MPEEGDFSAPIDTADKKRQHLPGEDLRQPRVVQARDLMEDARCVHAALGRQEMDMGMNINPIPEGLDGRDDAGRKRTPGHNLEISGQGPKGQAAEIPQQLTLVDGQNPRVRQENITNRSSPQSEHRIRAALRSPHETASVHEGRASQSS